MVEIDQSMEKNILYHSTFDPRLISVIPSAVALAAMKSGVRKKIENIDLYRDQLTNRLDPSMSLMQKGLMLKLGKKPKTVVFAEGEDENMLKAAIEFGKIS